MSAISKWAIGPALLAGAAYGQVPSTNDTSDGHGNTGMGTDALGGPNPVNRQHRLRVRSALLQHVRR
jgi:hypothetical protein